MKILIKSVILIFTVTLFTSCDVDDDDFVVDQTGNFKVFQLNSVANPNISGTARFIENSDNTTTIELQLTGTPDGGQHPAHIHFNTAAEGGDIALTLGTVNGDTGFSTVTTSTLNDGTMISYNQLLQFDGYINVHLSADELETLVAQGDIGQNELTATTKVYALGEVDVDGISGTATFTERVNGEVLATLALQNTPDGGMHPAHIHNNTALEGGDIAYTFNAVNGTTGTSNTNFDDISFENILAYDGYINVHLSMEDLTTLVAQGDIGENELVNEKVYALGEVDVDGISGTATFNERANGEVLATLELQNTPDGGMHPAHIHANTAAEGGDIVYTFTAVDGTTGMSQTNFDAFTYEALLDFDSYINVHLSMDNLSTLVAQGDIGQNELTGASTTYALATVDVAGISGDVMFEERMNGEALATITLAGTPDGGMHPAHIHAGSVATAPGAIVFTFNPVNGTTGVSKTNVSVLDDDTAFGYDAAVAVDGYVNVHLSIDDLATLVAQGNVGANAN